MKLAKLKQIINASGKTKKECAEAIGCSEPNFYKKLSGKVPLFLEEAENLGLFLGMEYEEMTDVFLRDEEKEEPVCTYYEKEILNTLKSIDGTLKSIEQEIKSDEAGRYALNAINGVLFGNSSSKARREK